MALHKVSELEGVLLDAAVAKALALSRVELMKDNLGPPWVRVYETPRAGLGLISMPSGWRFAPSTEWHCGGPLLDQYRVGFLQHQFRQSGDTVRQVDAFVSWGRHQTGRTMLEAGMRAIVASKFGDEVEL